MTSTVTTLPGGAAGLLAAVRGLREQVSAAADEGERLRRLPDDVVDALKQAGVFRMTVPRRLGGLEVDPLVQLEVIETLSSYDASTGWVAMIGSDGGYYAAFLDPSVAAEVNADVDAVTAGYVNGGGRGEAVLGGFRLTGRWPFGSASCHADWFANGFFVHDNGSPRLSADGRPDWRVAMIPAAQCQVLDTWDTLGLRGSGSNDYVVEDVLVREDHTFSLLGRPRADEALYRFPGMFLTNFGAAPLGAARRALDAFAELAATKTIRPSNSLLRDLGAAQTAICAAEAAVGSARSFLYDTVGELWTTVQRGDDPTLKERARVWLATTNALSAARTAVEHVVGAAGASAVFTSSPLQRALRDVTTMNQHVFGQATVREGVGRMLLGLESGLPVL